MSEHDVPQGATHYYPGDDAYRMHYIMQDADGNTYTWVTGMCVGDFWSDVALHAPIETCYKIDRQ